MHEPWRMVLRTEADGSTTPTRVWLPPLPGTVEDDGDRAEGPGIELPSQRGPGTLRETADAAHPPTQDGAPLP